MRKAIFPLLVVLGAGMGGVIGCDTSTPNSPAQAAAMSDEAKATLERMEAQDSSLMNVVNAAYGSNTASAISPGEVDLTTNGQDPMRFISGVLSLPITPPQAPPTIIVDAQSGTIVMNAGVTLGPAVVSHGDLTVNIQTQNAVSQPGPFSNGQTAGVQNTVVSAKQGKSQVIALPHAATLQDVAAALNAVGASPSDLIAIIEALKQAGAINGTIKVI